jgi:trehalose 6-phosphate synthase
MHPGNGDGTAMRVTSGTNDAPGRLVVVSNRVADPSLGHRSGGLAVAVGEALIASGGMWFGWSGETDRDAERRPPQVREIGDVTTVTMPLTAEEFDGYYLGFANRCLWPLFHYRLDLADLRAGIEAPYFAVNRRFATALAPYLKPDDTIWVHDYQLIPLASYLRTEKVTNPIGFFLHIPFPPPEIMSALPAHRELARTLFAYDLVGFQTVRDRENFARYAVEHLDCRRLHDGSLKGFGRALMIDAFPIGIDAEAFAAEADRNARSPKLKSMARGPDTPCYVVGVDRLDYTKGLPERIRGFEAFLKSYRAYRGKVQFLQVAPSTRARLTAYQDVRAEVERLIGHANGRFGDFSWSPIRYVHKAVPRPVLAGLFRRCRVGLVTPLRDGMNLVAKEYVAAQDPEDPGVLVLSQFAGAAEQLEEALIVNPHDPASLATAMRRAIEMPLGERRARYRALWGRISDQDVTWWRRKFLGTLAKVRGSKRNSGGQTWLRPETGTLSYERRPDQTAG